MKEKTKEIIIQFIEQNISDIKPDDDEEYSEEQFYVAEVNSLTQRFEIIARL